MAIAPSSAGAMPPANPMAGAAPPDDAAEAGGEVVVTISKEEDGSYMVYAGDEPEEGGGADMSMDDTEAMGAAGAVPAPTGGGASAGQPADSIGAALKIAMDILQADKGSEGAPGNADDQLAAGFGAAKTPTPTMGPSTRR